MTARSHHRQTQAQGELEDEAEEIPRPTPEGEVPRPTPADEAPPPDPDKPPDLGGPPDHTLPQGPDVAAGLADLHAAVQALTRAVGYLAGNAPPFVRLAVEEAERALSGIPD